MFSPVTLEDKTKDKYFVIIHCFYNNVMKGIKMTEREERWKNKTCVAGALLLRMNAIELIAAKALKRPLM